MANTPLGYPYPVGTDRVMDGDDVIAALAAAVDDKLGVQASGTVAVTITALGTSASTTVTFPAGRFTAPPWVVLGLNVANPQQWQGSMAGVSAGGFTAYAVRSSGGTPGTVNIHWHATQQSG